MFFKLEVITEESEESASPLSRPISPENDNIPNDSEVASG